MRDWPSADDAEFAAGIILFRRTDARCEFLMLRNARHRSWGFPKGHAESGEDALETALRETVEETGIHAVQLIPEFRAVVEYTVRTGEGKQRRKFVVYYLGETAAEPVKSDEHDRMEWMNGTDALERIPHPNLRDVLVRVIASLPSG